MLILLIDNDKTFGSCFSGILNLLLNRKRTTLNQGDRTSASYIPQVDRE
jgi:hypothetical protein